jgi:hypothetical protein
MNLRYRKKEIEGCGPRVAEEAPVTDGEIFFDPERLPELPHGRTI